MPLYASRNAAGPRGERQARSANEGKEKEVGLGSPAASGSGALSPEVVSFHSRRDGLAERQGALECQKNGSEVRGCRVCSRGVGASLRPLVSPLGSPHSSAIRV